MIYIRGCSGFGDSCYLYPVVREYCKKDKVVVYSDFPDFFEPLRKIQPFITIQPFIRSKPVDVDCSYVASRPIAGTNTFQDTLNNARLPINTLFSLDYEMPKKRTGVILIAMPYVPKWCRDGACFVPDETLFKNIAENLGEFQIAWHHPHTSRSLQQWVELMRLCDYVITQSSHILCLAEALGKKTCVIFNHSYKQSTQPFVTYITTEKVICCPETTIAIMDNEGWKTSCSKIRQHLR